jgi:hypothetical protein
MWVGCFLDNVINASEDSHGQMSHANPDCYIVIVHKNTKQGIASQKTIPEKV